MTNSDPFTAIAQDMLDELALKGRAEQDPEFAKLAEEERDAARVYEMASEVADLAFKRWDEVQKRYFEALSKFK